MLHLRKSLVAMLVLVLLALMTVSISAQPGSALVRFVHVIPGLTAIDIYVNDSVAVEGLRYGSATTYMTAPSGSVRLRVTLAGLTTTLWQQTTALPAEDAVTLIASSINPLSFEPFRDDLIALSPTTGRFQAIHAIDGGPALEFIAAGQTVSTNLAYNTAFGPSDIPVNTYVMSAQVGSGAAANVVLPDTSVPVPGSTSTMLVIYGTAINPQTLLLSAPTQPDGDAAFVRVAHGIADAPSVDVLVDGQVVIPSLSYGQASQHLALPPGAYTASLRVAGGGAEIASVEVEFAAGTAATVVALGSAEAPEVSLFEDAIAGIDARTALVSVINTIADTSVSLSLGETVLAADLPGGEAAEVAALAPTQATLALDLTAGDADQSFDLGTLTLYGGVYYNLFVGVDAVGTPTVFVAPTSLAQTVTSAPNSSQAAPVVEAPTEEATTAETADTTTEAPPAATEVAQVATPAPATAAPLPTPVPPTPVPTTEFPTGRPVIDVTARLNLRTYPSVNSESRGQIPGSVTTPLNILGRQSDIEIGPNGLPVTLDIPADEDLGDPFAELDPAVDIPALDTWLYIQVANPEGGVVRAWVRSDFVEIRSQRGERLRLRDLPLVAANRAGEGTYGERPTAQVEIVEAVVFNLAPDVALIIRERLLPVVGQPLQRVFVNTRMELVGVTTLEDETEWAFVRYRPQAEANTVVSGWASTQYLRYEFRGQAITLEQLEARNLLSEVDPAEVGTVAGSAPAVVLPTADPFRDRIVATVNVAADTTLQFRPAPDTIFAPIASLPSGTRVVVVSRNGAANWLQVEFEGQLGWVAASFVSLSLNGRPVALLDVTVNEDFAATPEPTPTEEGGTAG